MAEPIRKLSKAKKSEAVSLGELIHQAVRVAIERAVHEELGQWKTIRTTNVIERLNEEFRRRVKTQGSLPGEEAVLVLLFSLDRGRAEGEYSMKSFLAREQVRYPGLPASGQRTAARSARSVRHAETRASAGSTRATSGPAAPATPILD